MKNAPNEIREQLASKANEMKWYMDVKATILSYMRSTKTWKKRRTQACVKVKTHESGILMPLPCLPRQSRMAPKSENTKTPRFLFLVVGRVEQLVARIAYKVEGEGGPRVQIFNSSY